MLLASERLYCLIIINSLSLTHYSLFCSQPGDLDHQITVIDGDDRPVERGVVVDDVPDPLLKRPIEVKTAPLTVVAPVAANLKMLQLLKRLNQQVSIQKNWEEGLFQ